MRLSILSLFCNKFYKFNNTGAQLLDLIYYMTLKYFEISFLYAKLNILPCILHTVMDIITVNSEIFARVLFSRNFAYAKFRENKILMKWRYHSVFSCHSSKFLASQICLLRHIVKIS